MSEAADLSSVEFAVVWWVLLFLGLWWGIAMLIHRYGTPFRRRHRKHRRSHSREKKRDAAV